MEEMGKLVVWFKTLKKWQKGGLIGCAVGILLAAIVIIEPGVRSLGGWIIDRHIIFFIIFLGIAIEHNSLYIYLCGGALAIVIFYGGLGAIGGRIQQINNPYWKWLLTALIALFLAAFYTAHVLGQ